MTPKYKIGDKFRYRRQDEELGFIITMIDHIGMKRGKVTYFLKIANASGIVLEYSEYETDFCGLVEKNVLKWLNR